MADGRSFSEIIVSQLGQPYEPFGIHDLVGLAMLAAVVAVYLLLEYGLGQLVVWLVRRIFGKARPKAAPPLD